MPGIYQNLDFSITQKQFIKCYKVVDFPPVINNIFTANISGTRGGGTGGQGLYRPCRGDPQ